MARYHSNMAKVTLESLDAKINAILDAVTNIGEKTKNEKVVFNLRALRKHTK